MDDLSGRFRIAPLAPPQWDAIQPLIDESRGEGFAFLDRLRREYEAGTNRFDAPGERLLGAFVDGALAAVGGVNRDPYAGDPRTGRIRHLYVARVHRGTGLGRALVRELMRASRNAFDRYALRTDTKDAARFYEAIGFARVRHPTRTHELAAAPESPV